MTSEQFLLVLCIAIALVGVVWALLAWRRRAGYGRVAHGLALSVAAVGLYLSGLLQLVWNGVKAVVEWVRSVTPDTTIWTGVSFLGAALLIFAVGMFMNNRNFGRMTAEQRATAKAEHKSISQPGKKGAKPAAVADKPATMAGGKAPAAKPAATEDLDDMAEIEAILKGRGIQ